MGNEREMCGKYHQCPRDRYKMATKQISFTNVINNNVILFSNDINIYRYHGERITSLNKDGKTKKRKYTRGQYRIIRQWKIDEKENDRL